MKAHAIGARVRCFFGTEYRDGAVEFVRSNGEIGVRLSPAWIHMTTADDVIALPSSFIHGSRVVIRPVGVALGGVAS